MVTSQFTSFICSAKLSAWQKLLKQTLSSPINAQVMNCTGVLISP